MYTEDKKDLEKVCKGFSRFFYELVLAKIDNEHKLYDFKRDSSFSNSEIENSIESISLEDEITDISYDYIKEFINNNSLESKTTSRDNIIEYISLVKDNGDVVLNNYYKYFSWIDFDEIDSYSIYELFDNYEIFSSVDYLVDKPFIALDIYRYVLENIHKIINSYRELSDVEYTYVDDLLLFFYSLMQRRLVESANSYQSYLSLASFLEKLEIYDYYQIFDSNVFAYPNSFIKNLYKAVAKNDTEKFNYLKVFLLSYLKADDDYLKQYSSLMPEPHKDAIFKSINYYLFKSEITKVRNLFDTLSKDNSDTWFKIYRNKIFSSIKSNKYCTREDINYLMSISDDNEFLNYLESKSSYVNYQYFVDSLCSYLLDEKTFSIRSYNTILYYRPTLSLTYLNNNLKYLKVENAKEYFALSLLLFDRNYVHETLLLQKTLLELFIDKSDKVYCGIVILLYNQIKILKDFFQYQTKDKVDLEYLTSIKEKFKEA